MRCLTPTDALRESNAKSPTPDLYLSDLEDSDMLVMIAALKGSLRPSLLVLEHNHRLDLSEDVEFLRTEPAVSSRRTKDDEDDAVFVDAQQSTLMAWCLMERRRLARGGVVGTDMQHLRSPNSGKKPKKY